MPVLVFLAFGQVFSTYSRSSGGSFSRCACNRGVTNASRRIEKRKKKRMTETVPGFDETSRASVPLVPVAVKPRKLSPRDVGPLARARHAAKSCPVPCDATARHPKDAAVECNRFHVRDT